MNIFKITQATCFGICIVSFLSAVERQASSLSIAFTLGCVFITGINFLMSLID